MGFTDGFGGNSWRLVTTAAVREEVKLCPSVTKLYYADGQGKTDKAISDIKGMVAKGVKALVVFPDAGQAMLPALRSAYKAGVVTVPYRVWAGGVAGKVQTSFLLASYGVNGLRRIFQTVETSFVFQVQLETAKAPTKARVLHQFLDQILNTSSSVLHHSKQPVGIQARLKKS